MPLAFINRAVARLFSSARLLPFRQLYRLKAVDN